VTRDEWKPPIETRLAMTWTCIVCRCDQESGRTCRVINRPPGTLTLAHAERVKEIITVEGDTAGDMWEAIVEDLDENYDDVICERCDPEALRAALTEALDYATERDVMAEPGGWKRVDDYEARISALRKLL
jgi:hypothetical protein